MREINTPIMKFGFVLSAVLVIVVLGSLLSSFLEDRVGQDTELHIEKPGFIRYIDTDFGFSASIPETFTMQPDYFYYALGPAREIPGVKFNIPQTMATGTNLSSDSGISIELLSRAACTPKDFLLSPGTSTSLYINDYEYTFATSSDAGAGNIYEESIFVHKNNDLCYGVRYFIHSTQIGNYPEDTVSAFDKKALESIFQNILTSIKFI